MIVNKISEKRFQWNYLPFVFGGNNRYKLKSGKDIKSSGDRSAKNQIIIIY